METVLILAVLGFAIWGFTELIGTARDTSFKVKHPDRLSPDDVKKIEKMVDGGAR